MKSELKSRNKKEVTQDTLNFSLIFFGARLLCPTQGEGTHKGIKKEHKTILIKGKATERLLSINMIQFTVDSLF